MRIWSDCVNAVSFFALYQSVATTTASASRFDSALEAVVLVRPKPQNLMLVKCQRGCMEGAVPRRAAYAKT